MYDIQSGGRLSAVLSVRDDSDEESNRLSIVSGGMVECCFYKHDEMQ